MFSETLLDHFQNPRNAGNLDRANVTIEVTNPVCGDVLRLAAITENGVVREVRFLCRGCTAAIACGSLLTQKIRGKRPAEFESIEAAGLAEQIGGLPEASFHAAVLAEDAAKALAAAVANA